MTDAAILSTADLLLLQTWFSPSFPIGAFTYSHGIESAIADELIDGPESLTDWLSVIIEYGSARNDAILMSVCRRAASAADWQTIESADLLAIALCAGAEREQETRAMGTSFSSAVMPWFDGSATNPFDAFDAGAKAVTARLPYDLSSLNAMPVIVGTAAGLQGLPERPLVATALQASIGNLIWIAARLIPLGQTQALRVVAALTPAIQRMAHDASQASLDDLGTCTLMADMASLNHEHLPTRVCRT